ncbi:MAG: S9 family peptidase [candidate division Zixibacteria bacterium]|nr:S9 family peptidase [candidate division Zixibacteria bacterium]
MKKRKVTIADLLQLKFVGNVAMSPDETEIAFSVKSVAEDKKKYFSHIYLVNVDGSNLRQYTFGEVSDSAPVFSPDGKTIAFISKRGKKKGIYVIPRHGGEARLLVEKDGAFSELSFSPDSKKILCIFRKDDEVPKDKQGKKEPPVYRHITRMIYKMDAVGFFPKAEGQIWTFDIATGKGKALTRGGRGKESPSYSPNGRQIVYITNIRKQPDIDVGLTDIFVMPTGGGKSRKIATPDGPAYLPQFSPDGNSIAYLGHDNPNDPWGVTNFHIWKVPVRGGKATDLTKKLDRQAFDLTISDTAEMGSTMPPYWSADGKWIYFQVSDAGSTHLYRVSASGRKMETIVSGKLHVVGFSLAGKTTRAALVVANHTTPAGIHVADVNRKSKPQCLTEFNKELTKTTAIGKPEEVIFRAYDGYPVHGWILKPFNFSPRRKYPSILQIHGGPRVQYGNTFFHEMQFLAAQGYVVYYANPRGGQGYGEKHADTITANWGTVDHEDCMAFADFMEKKPYIDRRRMGVTGGSYGGFMTNWIVSHTNRFAAAVTQRSVVNLESMFGSSDFGFHMPREIAGDKKATPFSHPDSYRRQSPLTYVTNIRTPLLIIHSEQDLRCPIEQAEQLFISLKMLNRKVEFLRFPGEPHGLSRDGRPDRRQVRLEWILKWFNRYLKGSK